jgi:hypothetical protein
MIEQQLKLIPTSERLEDQGIAAPLDSTRAARWVGDYATTRGGRYFRFYWQEYNAKTGRLRTRHCPIRGGNVDRIEAQANAAAIRAAIAAGEETGAIVKLCRSQKALSGNYKREIVQE